MFKKVFFFYYRAARDSGCYSKCEYKNVHQGCDCVQKYEAVGGAKPSCSCTSSVDKQGPWGRRGDYRRLHDELM